MKLVYIFMGICVVWGVARLVLAVRANSVQRARKRFYRKIYGGK